ncbi:uncharacterized protein LOC121629682 isoform X1 [Melanotaenia boesemani]|uniref:uncharacterized protein LOC121629682 isoform X1 n=1 Tax=Melanotaenia boesemani TaxID=1250792 RepID=UPI001C04D4B6|nr:uncharacterized protein LOC121629682 isoform X1 [Melanotaenia boesemani]XP_041825334.1 uncharacterized protein LOC121629682 isoform X1 [Melanotaenia boesemani]
MTMIDASSKYQDFISTRNLIRPGHPAVYQLRTKKEEFGSLTRMTVGKKDVNKINKTILLVGETGTGKSTLINALVNYSMGVKWEDGVWFQIVEEKEEKRSQTESQTSDVMMYQMFGFEGKTLPYSLTIIDTPGFGDSRGIKQDDIISQRLLEWFRSDDGVQEINAVGLVVKWTENRLSDRLMYVFNSVTSLFGKNMEKNIVALITHSDGRNPKNALQALEAANIKCSRDEENQPVYFLFNNCQHEHRTEEEEESLKADYKISQRGMKQFTLFLEKTGPQKLKTTIKVLNERIRLTACIQNLQDRISLTELKQTEIRQIQEALKKHEGEMKENQNFTVEVDEVYKEKEDIDGGRWGLMFYKAAVTCTVCEENCHYPGCTMARKPEHCEVIKKGRCTVCTRKCPASDHVKEKRRYVTKTRKVQKTMVDMEEKYVHSKTESQSKSTLLENLGEEIKKLTAERSQLLDEAYHHVVKLEEIALNADSVSTYVHLDFLIEKMKEEGDKEKVQKLEKMKSREDEGSRPAVQYVEHFRGKIK